MTDSLYLPVQRSARYPGLPRLIGGALRLVYEFASYDNGLHGAQGRSRLCR